MKQHNTSVIDQTITDSIYSNIIHQISGTFFVKDARLNYLVANDYFSNLMGLDNANKVIGKSDVDFPKAPVAINASAAALEKVFNAENRMVLAGNVLNALHVHLIDDEVMIFKTHRRPLKNGGEIAGVITQSQLLTSPDIVTINKLLNDEKLQISKPCFQTLAYYYRRIASSLTFLSKRELQCLLLVAQGKTNREIAEEISRTQKTIEFHVSNLKTKLQCKSRSGLTDKVLTLGLADITSYNLVRGLFV